MIALAGVDTTGGKSLGPRLLLPLLPLLAASALLAIQAYLRAPGVLDKYVGIAGVALVSIAIAIHAFGTIPAYVARNRMDVKGLRAVADSGERIVVADDEFTAQLLFPLYYRKNSSTGRHARAVRTAWRAAGVATSRLAAGREPLERYPGRLRSVYKAPDAAVRPDDSSVLGTVTTVKSEREQAQKSIAENRKAFHDYHILETFEAGVALLGTEVKSIREGNVNLRDSYARVEGGEVWIYNVHISPYSHRGYADHEPTRRRKLLLHRQEIRKLIGKTVEKGMTLVPDADVFQERPRQGGDRPGQGQEGARQARDDQAARGGSRDARGGQGAALRIRHRGDRVRL